MTHADFLYDSEGMGISVEEARARGWDLSLWKIEEISEPEAIKDANHRRTLIAEGMKLWEQNAEKWRTCRMEYLFYLTMKKKLKVSKCELRQGIVIRGFKLSRLLEKLNRIDAYQFLSSLSDGALFCEISFTKNWVCYDFSYTSLNSWNYDFRQILKRSRIDESYKGDLFDHLSDYQKPGKMHSFWKPVKPVAFKSRVNEYSRSAAMY